MLAADTGLLLVRYSETIQAIIIQFNLRVCCLDREWARVKPKDRMWTICR